MELLKADYVKLDQDLWLIQIKEGLQFQAGVEEEENEICVCVFAVPKELSSVRPEAYIPQCISIGPYHHWRSHLYEMERYKVAAARRFEKTITFQFEGVVDEIMKCDYKIRNCYHKYVEYKRETLAWLMSLDASFLLDCLQFQVEQTSLAGSQLSFQLNRLGRVLDPSGRSTIHNTIMRDLTMLENQLPLFLLQKLLEIQLGCKDKAEKKLANLVALACKEWSPFMSKKWDSSRIRINERGHILEAIYYSIVPGPAVEDTAISKNNDDGNIRFADSTCLTRTLKASWKALSSIRISLVQLISVLSERLLKERPVQLVAQLSNNLFSAFQTLSTKGSDESGEETDEERGYSSAETPPTRDELDIPSVSDLLSAGIKFLPTEGDLSTVRFDPTTATLYLPKLRLNSNTEVVLRNLVAFEASAAPGDLVFTRYTDFMNGIIDTEEDVRLLRKSGIIYNYLADDGKVASLWNGMGKCVKLTQGNIWIK